MGENNNTESSRGDESVTQQHQGDPGRQPEKPMTAPDATHSGHGDEGRKAAVEDDLADSEDPEELDADTAVKSPGQDDK